MEYSKTRIAIGAVVLIILVIILGVKTRDMLKESETTVTRVIENVDINGNRGDYAVKEISVKMNRFSGVHMTAEERKMLCGVIYDLAGGKSQVEQRRVCEIVFNRVLSDDFPDTVEKVINDIEPCAQFDTVSGQGGEYEYQEKIIDIVMFDEPLTESSYYYY